MGTAPDLNDRLAGLHDRPIQHWKQAIAKRLVERGGDTAFAPWAARNAVFRLTREDGCR